MESSHLTGIIINEDISKLLFPSEPTSLKNSNAAINETNLTQVFNPFNNLDQFVNIATATYYASELYNYLYCGDQIIYKSNIVELNLSQDIALDLPKNNSIKLKS